MRAALRIACFVRRHKSCGGRSLSVSALQAFVACSANWGVRINHVGIVRRWGGEAVQGLKV